MTEKELRQKILNILDGHPEVGEVYDKCSGIEFGIDIIFKRNDIFKVSRTYGIQIKTKNINSTKNRKTESVKDIIAQLAIAFGHYFPEGYLDAVYVVTSGSINSYAAEHIKAARIGFREVYFVDKQFLDKFILDGEARSKTYCET